MQEKRLTLLVCVFTIIAYGGIMLMKWNEASTELKVGMVLIMWIAIYFIGEVAKD